MTTTSMSRPPREQQFVFYEVDWKFYDLVLGRLADRPVFVTYDRGSLEIMSPSEKHESFTKLIGRMIEAATEEWNIPVYGCRSTTFRREDLDRGLEPDECYYIQNEALVRTVEEIDLTRDPPPDLAIEVEISRRLLDREGIYAALGVPELWRYDGKRLRVFLLGVQGRYGPSAGSRALPRLPTAEVERFLHLRKTTDDTSLIRAFRAWCRENSSSPPLA